MKIGQTIENLKGGNPQHCGLICILLTWACTRQSPKGGFLWAWYKSPVTYSLICNFCDVKLVSVAQDRPCSVDLPCLFTSDYTASSDWMIYVIMNWRGKGGNCRYRFWSSVPAFSPRKPQNPRSVQAIPRQRFELDIYWIEVRNVTVWAIVLGHELHEWHSHSDFFTTLHSRLCEELWRIWTCSWNLSKQQLKLYTVSSSVTVA